MTITGTDGLTIIACAFAFVAALAIFTRKGA